MSELAVSDLLMAHRGMFRPLAVDEHVKLVVEEPAQLNTMFSDERELAQILRNLVSNALKFTERGELRVQSKTDGHGSAVFTVSDTGLGIARENLERIFEDYTQIDSGAQRRVKGTGLGLPLTRKLVHLIGGKISVESEVGVGSTFTVVVPVKLPIDSNASAGSRSPELAGGSARGQT